MTGRRQHARGPRKPPAIQRTVTVRRFAADEWRAYRELRLGALRESPDAFASTFDREAGFTDILWASRLAAGAASERDLPVVAELDGELVGLAWARIDEHDPSLVHVHQVWVAPHGRGHGAGSALVDAVCTWARSAGAEQVELCVTCGNSPARRLYERAGFIPVGDPQALRVEGPLLAQSMCLTLREQG